MDFKTCNHCGRILPDDYSATLCGRCAKMNAARARKYRQERKEKGLCVYCGRPKEENGVFCKECAKYMARKSKMWRSENPDYQKQYRKRLKEQGICAQCHGEVTDGKCYCESCREKHNAYLKEYNKKRYAETKRNALYGTLEA